MCNRGTVLVASEGEIDDVRETGGLETGEHVHRNHLDAIAPGRVSFAEPGLEHLLRSALDPAGQHRTTGLEPLTHDLQAEFVKTAERAQVRAHEGSVRRTAPIGHPRMSWCRHSYRVDWSVGVSARIR
jgi:hypothetical protein